jgi:hypothetical protein
MSLILAPSKTYFMSCLLNQWVFLTMNSQPSATPLVSSRAPRNACGFPGTRSTEVQPFRFPTNTPSACDTSSAGFALENIHSRDFLHRGKLNRLELDSPYYIDHCRRELV